METMALRRTVVVAGIVGMSGLTGAGPVPAQEAEDAPAAATARAALDRYCVTCHNERLRTAGLALDAIDPAYVGDDPEIWEKVVRKLRTGMMPPAPRPRPDADTYSAVVDYLEAALDRAADASPDPGRPALQRLNRAEYTNAIRDLLALEVDGRALLPADDSGYGFDNIGDVLSVSPGLLERYCWRPRRSAAAPSATRRCARPPPSTRRRRCCRRTAASARTCPSGPAAGSRCGTTSRSTRST